MIKEFKTTKGRFISVEVPVYATNKMLFQVDKMAYLKYDSAIGDECTMVALTREFTSVTIVGIANQLTEEQWAEIVDTEYPLTMYKNYINKGFAYSTLTTATESGQSLMQSIGCPIVNPLGKEPEMKDFEYEYDKNYQPEDDFDYDAQSYKYAIRKWQTAEKEIKNYLILKIKG